MPEVPVTDVALSPDPKNSYIRTADRQADQQTYIKHRAKGLSDRYIVKNWQELGFTRQRSRKLLYDWRKKLREPIRVAVKYEVLETAAQLNLATLHRVAGFGWVMQRCFDEMKKRVEADGEDGFASMTMRELIQETRATSIAVGHTLQPYETEVDKVEQNNIYMQFFNKISVADDDGKGNVVDAEWSPAEESGQEETL